MTTKGEVPETEANDAETPEVTEEPTIEQQLETLKADLEAEKEKFQKAESSAQGLKGSLQEKDRQLREQTSIQEEISSLRETQKILAAAVAEGYSGDISDEKQNLLKKFDDLDVKQKQREDEAKQKAAQSEFEERIKVYQQRVQTLGLTEKDDDYWAIYDMVTSGNVAGLKRADIKLDKLEKEKETVVKAEPSEVDELKKEIASMKKELDIAKGELDAETGLPSNVSLSDMQNIEKYNKGEKLFDELPETAKKKLRGY